jgi:regulatory protein
MPVVTAIKSQRRPGSNRFNVSLDGAYSFTISDLDLSTSGLKVGQELTQAEADSYAKQAVEAKAYALALRYLGVRQRSRRELVDYLKRKGCEPEEIELALERLEELGLVDDQRFAESWIADRMVVRPRSRMRLAQELAAKGVSRDTVDAALRELEPDQELQTLKDLIERKWRTSGYGDETKLIGYLQRQGYRWDLIKEALQQLRDAD